MLEGWSDFFVAVAGAGAALAGLIIVAMSVNIREILQWPSVSSRGASAVASLILAVVTAVAGLIPEQALTMLGLEILIFTVITLVVAARTAVAVWGDVERRRSAPVKIAAILIQLVPFLIGAVLLLTGAEAGLYWLAAGMLLVFIGSTGAAWVLLVEILR